MKKIMVKLLKKCSFFLLLLFVISANGKSYKGKNEITDKRTLLAIFAHPDDEMSAAPLLAKYVSEGVSIYIAIVTDGRLGVTTHAGISAGDNLANIRIEEMNCSTTELGVNPPIMMGFYDQFKFEEGMEAMMNEIDRAKKEVQKLIEDIKPDVVLTWGPSGGTGHLDHRIVNTIVSEVFGSKQWDGKPHQLYTTEITIQDNVEMAMVDISYLNFRIPIEKIHFETAKKAWMCHKSQFTLDEVLWLKAQFWDSQNGVAFFKPFYQKGPIENSLFKD
ncbi:PIG-L deacetylase family protein [Flagellimonas olearia]|uniref:PIG-L family deacetylase n=1 Tax=Flagellimonas olearia TaxID=552546 RepID=A0A444VLY8_9FLAO|nr:PIG-L family deacetylase [Allomuricauda olearia]RYC51739.1 hypothetical protein DN53_12985 [Allomuricauda olearia]